MASRPIVISIQGDDSNLRKALKGAAGKVEGFGKSVAKIGVTAGAAFGASAIAIGTKGVTAFAEYDKGLREVLTLLPGAGQEVFDELGGQVKDFSKEFGVMTDEAIPALYSALSAGVPQDNVMAFLEVAQAAAVGGVTDLTTSVDALSSVTNSYGSEVISATEASDLMFTAVRLGKTTFEEIGSSIFQMAPIASAVGIPFENLTASIAALSASGTPTSVAATQMKAAMAELAKGGSKADVAFRDLAGVGLQQFLTEGGSFDEAIVMMKEGADEAGISVLDMFGSIEAGQAVLSLTADGGENFRGILDEMAASGGATQGAFETMDAGMGASFNRIKANVQVLMIEIGEKLAPLVAKATDWILKGFNNLKPTLAKVQTAVVSFAKKAKDFLVPVIKTVYAWVLNAGRAVADFLTPVFGAVADAAGWVAEKFMAAYRATAEYLTPGLTVLWEKILAVKDALIDLVQMGIDWVVEKFNATNWGKVGEDLLAAFEKVREAVMEFVRGIPDGFRTAIEWVQKYRKWIVTLGGAILAGVVAFKAYKVALVLIDKWNKLVAISTKLWTLAMNANPIGLVVAAIVLLIGGLAAAYTQFESVRNVVDKVMDVFQEMAKVVWPVIKAFINHIIDLFKGLWNTISEVVRLVKAIFTGDFSEAFDALKGAVSSALGLIIEWFFGLPIKIITALAPFAGKLVKWIGEAVADLFTALWDWYTGTYLDFWLKLPGRIISAVADMGSKFVGWIGDALTKLWNALWDWWIEDFLDFYIQLPGRVINAVADMGSKFVTWITGAVGSLFTSLWDWYLNTYIDFWIKLPGRVIDKVAAMGTKLSDWISGAVGTMFTTVSDWVNVTLLPFFFKLPGRIVDNASLMLGKVFDLGKDIGTKVLDGFKNIISSATEFATRMKDSIVGFGGDIIGWIVDGIKKAGSAIWDALKSVMADNIPSWVPGWLNPFDGDSSKQSSRRTSSIELMSNAAAAATAPATGLLGGIASQLDLSPGSLDWFQNAETIMAFRQKGKMEEFNQFKTAGDLSGMEAFVQGGFQTPSTNIAVTVNAGLGTDGNQVGDQIVTALTQWERTNGSIPISVEAM